MRRESRPYDLIISFLFVAINQNFCRDPQWMQNVPLVPIRKTSQPHLHVHTLSFGTASWINRVFCNPHTEHSIQSTPMGATAISS